MRIENLETPALLVDRDIFEENQKKMNQLLAPLGIVLRPHYKSHKSTLVARLQIAAGAKGITCAKVAEAEDLALAGIEDILIANQVTEKSRIARCAWLAKGCRLSVCVDTLENIHQLEQAAAWQGSTIHCLVEYEVGMGRCGVSTPAQCLTLARTIAECPHLVFDGIQAYAGHLSHEVRLPVRQQASEQVETTLKDLKAYLKERGIGVAEISGASTGTVELRRQDTVYTEIQAGSYLFMDATYKALDLRFENSMTMLATVISTRPDLVVTDAGVKCLGVDQGDPVCPRLPGAAINMSEEHSAFTLANHGLQVGDRVHLVPGHCCTTMNLNDFFYFTQGGKVVDRVPVTSRGKSK